MEENFARVNPEAARIDNISATIDSLVDMLNLNKDELKEKMIIKALKNLNNGYGSGYVGNLYSDILELITRLTKERDEAKSRVGRLEEKINKEYRINQELFDRTRKLLIKEGDAKDKLRMILISPPDLDLCYKKKYSYNEVLAAEKSLRSELDKRLTNIIETLTEDTKQK